MGVGPVHDDRRRARPVPRPVHPAARAGRDAAKALLGFAAPKHRAAAGPAGERRPTPERMGRRFEYVERFPTDRLPSSGGVNATVVVTMDLATLLGGHGAGQPGHRRVDHRRAKPAGWRVRPGSSPPSSAAPLRSSTSAAPAASTPKPNASRWASETQAAPPRGVTIRPGSATPTTTTPGPTEATPACDGRLLCPRHHARSVPWCW